jgi:hypothetical protein
MKLDGLAGRNLLLNGFVEGAYHKNFSRIPECLWIRTPYVLN